MGHIYKHTSPSGKAYIGQSWQEPEARWKQHLWDAGNGSELIIHRAIRKYGPDAFTTEILHDGIDDLEELNRLEIEEIAAHGTFGPGGYNMTPGGDRIEHTPLIRRRMSKVLKARWADQEYKAARLEKTITREYRAKIGAKSKEYWQDPNYRELFSESLKATLATPKAKARKSRAMRNVLKDPEKYAARVEQVRAARAAAIPRVMIEGLFFRFIKDAGEQLDVNQGTARWRVNSHSRRFRWWQTIPNHNDPECDAVEECWALMQFAAANPDHENVPSWIELPDEIVPDMRQGYMTRVPEGFWNA